MEAAKTFSTLLVAVAVVSLLVGGIGVMNVMLATVTERTREIGLRIAVGARPWHVRIQFLLEGILLCVAGGLLGVAISFAGSALIGHQIGWSLTIRPEAVVLGVVMSTLIGIVFGSLPAWRASKLDPITALRDE
jgi:putative ABC transport system permease protein